MRTYIEKVKRYIVSWMQKNTGFQFLWNVGPVYMMLSKGPTFLGCCLLRDCDCFEDDFFVSILRERVLNVNVRVVCLIVSPNGFFDRLD